MTFLKPLKSLLLMHIVFILTSFAMKTSKLCMKLDSKDVNNKVTSKGFGKSSVNSIKPSPISNTKSLSLEETIQQKIDKEPGLREIMDLQNEIESYDSMKSKMNIIQQLDISDSKVNLMRKKTDRRNDLVNSGWNDVTVHNKLMELTWDSSAQFRNSRHMDNKISDDMNNHMIEVAKWTMNDYSDSNFNVLDVGAGTGIMNKFLIQYRPNFNSACLYGVDLSNEMIKVARENNPKSKYFKIDFLNYNPTDVKFSSIIFNECLHNFLNVEQTIEHASKLLNGPKSNIVISNPRGYENIVLQKSKNKWLVPNLLPSIDELESITKKLNFKIILSPKIDSPHYLAVLQKE